MRIILLALAVFCTVHFVRMDLTDGTIPLAAFFDDETSCIEEMSNPSIIIRVVEGDTIESLFALYPDPTQNFLERLENFYSLNPHLERQQLLAGEQIKLPISKQADPVCEEGEKR
ncbi:hypothetical protein SporoP37_00090 [Sporosarcina sp. P37]|uniref:hypothetical protein n=1 Tax=unclassified Sporosarcina TaxID=2647733 RepID=UPI0009BDA8A2|nr:MULTISPECIES: hypothetical protein [unclassified Sporosarcina]ARD46789.1 hypothetical protein SporoP33_00085 [Sporosarcina sp. P33]ARK23240.1 hypothetical protein SporoP37_00090 [Sporosarcina sp. P37]PID19492.1 hypothetical protein CSV62_03040 [Sporosarcina sp. P35]